MKIKNRWKKLGLILLLIIGLPSYVVWDNNRVVVDDVTLSHAELPVSFDGYKILQITDLHEKTFGPEQKKLVNLIKKQQYNLVLFTGDYIVEGSGDLKPLEDLLRGMPKDKEMYYIPGHTDVNNSITSLVAGNRFFDLFAKYGVKPLYPGQKITINGESIWLKTNPYVGMNEIVDGRPSQQMIDAKKAFDHLYNNASNPFTVEVSHRPTEIDRENPTLHDYRTTTLGETDKEWIDWDLSINGFTHGGQFYLPLIGPVYAPGYDFFPGKVNISGVHTANGHTQYVSPGLGASGPSFARFRLFNTPTVGLITLKKA